jgi:hypothetical protein
VRPTDLERLIESVLEGDREVLEALAESGLIEPMHGYTIVDVEVARVARTLWRELDVNWEGVEIILRLRRELLETRRQLAEVLELLARERGEKE